MVQCRVQWLDSRIRGYARNCCPVTAPALPMRTSEILTLACLLAALAGCATAPADDAQTAKAGYRDGFLATENRYTRGLARLVELEDARRSCLASAYTTVGLQLERIQPWITLYRATGGGWTATARLETQP